MTEQVGGDRREALKRTAVALKANGLPFALGGGYGAWARGGPEPEHDVDFFVAADDADLAAAALSDQGLQVQQPAKDWLFKVYSDGAMVDVIHHLGAEKVPRSLLEGCESMEVLSVDMPVLGATEIVTQKLRALSEHECDLSGLLPVARALREQVAWERVRADVDGNPFAAAALFLFDRLGVMGRS